MKKIGILALVFVLAAAVTGCDPIPGFSKDKDADNTGGGSAISALYGETLSEDDDRIVGGYADGRIGDTMQTVWFSFKVNSAEKVDEYNGYTAADGNMLLKANITIKNTYGMELPMFSDDFQLQWGEGDQDFGYAMEATTDEELEGEFTLKKGESVTGDLVYELPAENSGEYSISYLEIYDDNVEGNVFFVYFELDK